MTYSIDPSLPAALQRPAIDNLEERELDLLLLQEFHTSPAFRAYFFRRVARDDEIRFVGAWRGVYTNNGESDLLLLSDLREQGRVAIMIEDKINAPFQPEQAQRYRLRGEQGQRDGMWDRFYTCLCSPNKYLPAEATTAWDAAVSFEDVLAELRSAPPADTRSVFLADAIQLAIKKYERSGFVVDAAATAFWQAYIRLHETEYATFFSMARVKERQSRNEPWPLFAAGVLPVGVNLEHKPSKGRVDLTFQKSTREEILKKLGPLLPAITPMQVIRVSPSAALSHPVGRLVHTDPFAEQETIVREAFGVVQKFLALWPTISLSMGYSPAAPGSDASGLRLARP